MNHMKLFRVLLMCLVAFALPVQGFASVSKVLCQHGTAPRGATVSVHEQHHHHEGMVMMLDEDNHDVHASTNAGALHQDHKCSSCAQCCLGSTMVGVMPTPFVVPVGSPVQVEGMRVLRSEVNLASIERPPQSLSL